MTKRKTFTEDFKRETVKLLESGDKSATELAAELGLRRNQVYKWQEQIRLHGDAAFGKPGPKPVEKRDEVARLRKELAEVKLERDILKKAAAYFAKDLT